jgi:hypothetical protein
VKRGRRGDTAGARAMASAPPATSAAVEDHNGYGARWLTTSSSVSATSTQYGGRGERC